MSVQFLEPDDGVVVVKDASLAAQPTARCRFVVFRIPRACSDRFLVSVSLVPDQQRSVKATNTGPGCRAILE